MIKTIFTTFLFGLSTEVVAEVGSLGIQAALELSY